MSQHRPIHIDDIVSHAADRYSLATVESTYEHVNPKEPQRTQECSDITIIAADHIPQELFDQFLEHGVPPPGTAFVRFYQRPIAALVGVSNLTLVHRTFHPGDLVRRSAQDAMCGLVLNTSTVCRLQPMCVIEFTPGDGRLKGATPEDMMELRRLQTSAASFLVDVPMSELKPCEDINDNDEIVWQDHVGIVDIITYHVAVRMSDNSVVEVPEAVVLTVDPKVHDLSVGDIVSAKKRDLRLGTWVYGMYDPNMPPVGTVVEKKVKEVEVSWDRRRIGAPSTGEPPTKLDKADIEADDFHVYDRTRYPTGKDRDQGSTTRSYTELEASPFMKVRFKDLAGACEKYNDPASRGKLERLDRKDTLGYDMNVFEVVGIKMELSILWQDLSITSVPSIDVIADPNLDDGTDEVNAWPGEIVHSQETSLAPDEQGYISVKQVGVVQKVSAVERLAVVKWCPNGQLQYHQDAERDAPETTILGVVGRAEGALEEVSLYDLIVPNQLNMRRGDTALLINPNLATGGSARTGGPVDWMGEIVDTNLDGSITVRLGALEKVRDVVVSREQLSVIPFHDDDESEADDDYMSDEEYDDDEMVDVRYEDENGMPLDVEDVEDESWESDDDVAPDTRIIDAPETSSPMSLDTTPPERNSVVGDAVQSAAPTASEAPTRYSMLDSPVPASHHFISQPPTVFTSAQMRRVQKEHKILGSPDTLPPQVWVRTWDSRLDLFRVLLVGPEETPYANAPFVIDLYLPPNFPAVPPEAFFHSWNSEPGLGGNGRVNPNLYENGTVCLSLLGTWSQGGKIERWQESKSTLLQVLVSILGLVLVREPYFNEAGFESLIGLESSRWPSVLYSEHSYLRSQSFTIKAIKWAESTDESGSGSAIQSLEDVVKWLYRHPSGEQLLKKSINHLEVVLQRSEGNAGEADGLTSMSKGACITLGRCLARLKEL